MDIYPQDLSPQVRVQVLRAQRYIGTPELQKLNPMFLTSLFGFAFGVIAEVGFRQVTSLLDVSLFGGAGTFIGLGFGYAERWRSNRLESGRIQGKKITQNELSMVSKHETNALKQDYLDILHTLISLPPSQDAGAMRSIRNTVRLLGETIEGLPILPEQSLFLDPMTLHDEASALREKARTETDAMIAASLQRQEAALTRRAETITRTATLIRRNQALHSEVVAQVKAIQTSLAAGQVNGSQGSSDFSALADHIAQMAQEANAIADARAELDTALVGVYRIPPEKPAISIAGPLS